MRSVILLIMTVMASQAWSEFKPKPTVSKKVTVGVTEAFIPSGFDSSADQLVVVNGYFPNGCYSFDSVKIVHNDNYNHEVSVFANVQQGICTMALIPYQKEVFLGVLAAGEHKLTFPSGDGTVMEKKFVVE